MTIDAEDLVGPHSWQTSRLISRFVAAVMAGNTFESHQLAMEINKRIPIPERPERKEPEKR